jgi:hypothetical protein
MTTSLTTLLDELALGILAGTAGSEDPWGGAGVVLRAEPSPPSTGSNFYPDKDEVVTPHVRQLSWLFIQLRDVVSNLDGYYMWKFEYFGRLAARAATVPTTLPADTLLLAVLYEAYELIGRLELGLPMPENDIVIVHPRTLGAGIVDFNEADMVAFYASRGITAG